MLSLKNGVLLYPTEDLSVQTCGSLVPKGVMLTYAHNTPYVGHHNAKATYKIILPHYRK